MTATSNNVTGSSSVSVFAHQPVVYYVNDGSITNDEWCTQPGDDANDGLTPATPKATIQAIIDAYALGPGDTVYVDTGVYNLSSDILIGSQVKGTRLSSFHGTHL